MKTIRPFRKWNTAVTIRPARFRYTIKYVDQGRAYHADSYIQLFEE